MYTRSQYRSQHYQTLATRCQSVPGDESRDSLSDLQTQHHCRSSSAGGPRQSTHCDHSTPGTGVDNMGGLYNIPQQRTSMASYSLDDLDTPSPNNPSSSNASSSSCSSNGGTNNNGHHHSTNNTVTPHHHGNHQQHHSRRQRHDSHDRSACRCLKALTS